MLVYVVRKEAVYEHEIAGIFRDRMEAVYEAFRAIAREKDDHHYFTVKEFGLDAPTDDNGRLVVTIRRVDRYNDDGTSTGDYSLKVEFKI